MPQTGEVLCRVCEKLDLATYFCREVHVCKDADGFVGPGEGAVFLKSLAAVHASAKTCDFCRMLLAALCKRDPPQFWETPEEHLDRISDDVEEPGIYLYSYLHAEDARGVDDNEGDHTIYKSFRLGIGLGLPVHTFQFINHAGTLQLLSTSCESLGLRPDFYGRIIYPERADMQLAKKWLEECVFEHNHLCDMPSSGPGDIYTGPCPKDLRVIDVNRMCLLCLPQESRYVTLSYRWGASRRQFTTTRSNIEELEVENSLQHHFCRLPQVIQDSIDCVRELGERFLWVDALCIIQDSPEEKDRLIRQMDRVYENSLVTIIAAPPGEPYYPLSDGLPGYRAGTRLFAQDSAYVHGLGICTSFPSIEMALGECPWGERAWTFQEELLSKRRLYFTASQLYFQCTCGVLCEDVVGEGKSPSAYIYCTGSLWNLAGLQARIGEGQSLTAWGLSRTKFKIHRKAIQYYKQLVYRYTGRDMADQGDVLVALDGVLAVLSKTMNTQFLYGLPEAYFDDAILWVTPEPSKRREATSNDLHNKPFPSWTWAGWEAASCYEGNSIGKIWPEAKWFLVTQDGCIAPVANTPYQSLSWEPLKAQHRDISPDYGNAQMLLPNLKPRSRITPEDVEAPSLACLGSIATFQFRGDIMELNTDWPEHMNFVISDAHGRPVGAIWMENTWSDKIKHQAQFEFLLLSRSEVVRYVPELDESLFPKTHWSYINVMLIKRQGNTAERLGVGAVHENAWVVASPTTTALYLR